ncbi:hypothetical protein GPECTOR_178g239 [Gonium pectorale]|uniref:SRCR domain-containing protein n=1 Tax=Gonium pectorale TaxID=33097 RepID=A0A150FYV3_GONPE|nr:hypothetical protein GPECTOR_178g239 [Gonium pectorale]|eukprot:KXZ42230.1 hypothetical protein GPECTOR_178g239 [Gonium pectorale]
MLALTLLLMLAQLSCGEYYGVRLAGSSGSVGRLEMMCQLLGYLYGRHHYSDELIYRPGDASLSVPVQINYCSAKSISGSGRRLVGRGGEGGDTGGAVAGEGGSSVVPGDRRQLYSPRAGKIDAAPDAHYECEVQNSICDKDGPLVALECSHTWLPELPRPPVRPVPGPTSAWVSGNIRLVGKDSFAISGSAYSTRLEPNLCNDTAADTPCAHARVEVEVPAPGGGNGTVWAPLCAPPPDVSAYDLARLMCRQALGLRLTTSLPYTSLPSTFDMPQGPVTTEGHFDPAKYATWATVTGGNPGSVLAVQDLPLNMTSSPCAEGKLFAMTCSVFAR